MQTAAPARWASVETGPLPREWMKVDEVLTKPVRWSICLERSNSTLRQGAMPDTGLPPPASTGMQCALDRTRENPKLAMRSLIVTTTRRACEGIRV